MKILVTYYSRTGNTKHIAHAVANRLKADIDEIIDTKKRSGIFGYIGGGRDALFGHRTKIEFRKNPRKYDLVIVGTPTWLYTATPAVKEYLIKNSFKKVAFFCTHGSNYKNVFREMNKLAGYPIATLEVLDKEVTKSKKKIDEFCNELKNS